LDFNGFLKRWLSFFLIKEFN
jgi:hypothetical protein